MKRLTVHPWPGPAPTPQDGVFVIGMPTTVQRELARAHLRRSLGGALGAVFNVAPDSVTVESSPGVAPVAVLPCGRRLHCSFAHDAGMSLAAVSLNGPVGVDLMGVGEVHDWESVARDYLGPEVTARIAAAPRPERAAVFARAWTTMEARMKWLGVGLEEWKDDSRPGGTAIALDLPAGLAGTLVYN